MTAIKDISFVVITYNEEFGIKKCLDSLSQLTMTDCEVICVDSGSSDNTIKYIKQYEGVVESLSLFQVRGYSSASVGRNIGLRHASKDFVFFIDGDIEVSEDFVKSSLEIMLSGKADAVTGRLEEYQYDVSFNKIIKKLDDRFKIKHGKLVYICGGCFISRRDALLETGFYIENYKKNEDIDYSLRLSRQYRLFAVPVSMGIHHTIAYDNNTRLRDQFFHEYRYYGKILLKNIFYLRNMFALLKRYSGITFGFIFYAIFLLLLTQDMKGFNFALYIVIIDVIYGAFQNKSIKYRVYLHYVAPLIAVIYAFFPLKSTSDMTVEKII